MNWCFSGVLFKNSKFELISEWDFSAYLGNVSLLRIEYHHGIAYDSAIKTKGGDPDDGSEPTVKARDREKH